MSPAAATTAEEAMASSDDHKERGASPASSGDAQCPVGAPAGQQEAVPEVEPWAAAVPPVRNEVFPGFCFTDCRLLLRVPGAAGGHSRQGNVDKC